MTKGARNSVQTSGPHPPVQLERLVPQRRQHKLPLTDSLRTVTIGTQLELDQPGCGLVRMLVRGEEAFERRRDIDFIHEHGTSVDDQRERHIGSREGFGALERTTSNPGWQRSLVRKEDFRTRRMQQQGA